MVCLIASANVMTVIYCACEVLYTVNSEPFNIEQRYKYMQEKIVIHWFRRDLRTIDNHALYQALTYGKPVLPIFIFDREILDALPAHDKRLTFIHQALQNLHLTFKQYGSGLITYHDYVLNAWKQITQYFSVEAVFTNQDYEPYAIQRDQQVQKFLHANGIHFFSFKDQVLVEKNEVLKEDGTPYTVYTPYAKKWKAYLHQNPVKCYPSENYLHNAVQNLPFYLHSLEEIGFKETEFVIPPPKLDLETLKHYAEQRDFPANEKGTSKLSVHLRFGTISIRKLYLQALPVSEKYVTELIWREFYMMILYHFPQVVHQCFKPEYEAVPWRKDDKLYQRWCEGKTGVPIVDAGIRELNQTGYMHNRVRMIVASFLTKNLLIHWRLGEAYFAEKLMDFELASNNGSWQWTAGCGVDAAPYFRVFNPSLQTQKFDPNFLYIRKWIPEWNTPDYPEPVVDLQLSAKKAIATYQQALQKTIP